MSIDPEQIFKYLDTKNTGYIKSEDIIKAIRYLGIVKKMDDLNEFVKSLPKEINYENYKEIIDKQKETSITKEKLLEAFEVFDEGKTGKCNANDLFHAVHVIGEKLDDDEIESIRDIADIDNEGKIEYAKFINKFLELK